MDDAGQYAYFEDVNWGLLRLWGGRRGLDVLDAGCGFATTSQRIREAGNRVTGIESIPEAVRVAKERIDEVIDGDLLDASVARELLERGRRFDAILFADVLEHLAWPARTLQTFLPLLKPGGSVIVSLPNVGLWSVRLALAFGRFQYGDTGVLDRTHLRFFTRRTAVEMLRAGGLEPFRRTYNPGIVRPFVPLAKRFIGRDGDPGSMLESRPYQAYIKAVFPLENALARVAPGLLAFQMIFEARPR